MNLKNTEKKEKSTIELTIEVTADEFEAACQSAYKKNSKKITVPGFRKGKAPRKMIEKLYGASFFWEDAVNESYPAAYEAALAEAGIEPVAKAEMDVIDINENGYTFKAIVTVKPEVSVSNYKGIKAEKPVFEVTDADVDAEIERTRKRNARIETVDREAKEGDTAVIDFEGFLNGEPFEGGKGEAFSLELGSGQFIPGFEEQLIGTKAGDERDLNVTFPEEYHAEELAGKAVVFKVKVHEIKESILPDLDDEFAKDVSEFDTLDEYKEDVKKQLIASREESAQNIFENSVLEKLLENTEVELPDAMIENQIDSIIENFTYQLSAQGMDFNSYAEMMGMKLEDMRQMYRPQAEHQLKMNLALEKIAEIENFEFSDEDVDAEYNKISEQYNMPVEQVKILLPVDSLKRDMGMQKASDLVRESAIAESPKAEEEEKPKKTRTKKSEEKDETEAKPKKTRKKVEPEEQKTE